MQLNEEVAIHVTLNGENGRPIANCWRHFEGTHGGSGGCEQQNAS